MLWGPRGYDGSLILHIGENAGRWRSLCGSIEIVDRFGGPYVMPYASRLILEWLNVGLWPKADMPSTSINVRYWK
jgi:hypothetical protein